MSQDLSPIDPKFLKIQGTAKAAGTVLVVGAASAAVVVVGASLITASVVAVVGLVMVNYVVPVAARSVALWRVKTMTQLTETLSEETIREDELKEGNRVEVLEQQYISSRAELEGAIEEISKQLSQATTEEQEILENEIAALRSVISNVETVLMQRKADLIELKRVNKLYITLHRSAKAMQKAHGAERNPEELQRVEIARNSIKTKMREAMAGKTIDSMNLKMKPATTLIGQISEINAATNSRKERSSNV